MNYVRLESGVIVEGPMALPENWGNISGFKYLTNEQLAEKGWYPYVFVPYEGSMDDKTYAPPTFSFTGSEYIEYQQVRDKTEQEIQDGINGQWVNVRARRNILLQECDWTQLGDVVFTPEKEQEWKEYRRQLRDITSQSDPFNLIWPTEPAYEPVIEPTGPTGPTAV